MVEERELGLKVSLCERTKLQHHDIITSDALETIESSIK